MMRKVRWGVLGAAHIAVKKVIPAMQRGEWSEIAAIASRDLAKAQLAASDSASRKPTVPTRNCWPIPKSRPSTTRCPITCTCPGRCAAAEAGKHVLCEKPLALDAAEARELLEAQARTGVKIGEAFMVRTHPQWLRARELVRAGRIGELRAIMGFFSYFNRDPANIRNVLAWGGGALFDIGCYPINTSRFIFGEEPRRVMALLERDPDMQTDRLTSAMLDFPSGQAVFTCSTQLVPYQRMQFFGTDGRIEIEIPFNAPPDRLAASSWTTAPTCSAPASRPRHSRSATSTPFRATCSRKPCVARAKCRCPSRTPCATWRSSMRCSVRPNPDAGRRHNDLHSSHALRSTRGEGHRIL
jgi:predicted dehydrogenase